MTYLPTLEQQNAVDAFHTGQNLVIEALAGTGKTSTLELIARSAPGRRGLYVAFNKQLQMEAQRRFAGTAVQARTAHSLAYAEFGAPVSHRLKNQRPVSWSEKADILGIHDKYVFALDAGATTRALSRQQLVGLTQKTIDAFCLSGETTITADLVPIPVEYGLHGETHRAALRNTILRFAERYWDDISRPDGGLRYQHDFYLKRWMLSNPILPYDYILFDEAQDADENMTAVIASQSATQIVAVGDRQQAIYGWRGAQDAMGKFGGTRLTLTQSWRFGDHIAAAANQWLERIGAAPDLRLRGKPGAASSVWKSERQPEAVLTRSNAGAIKEIVETQQAGHATGIAGERKAKELSDLARAAVDLKEKGYTRHPQLEMFSSWNEVVTFAESDDGSEIRGFVDVVEKFGPNEIVRVLDTCVPADQARTVVSTAHVAKGLEWLHVRIADDFHDPGTKRNEITGLPTVKPLPAEEARLIYVAVTRPTRHLDPSGLAWVDDYFGRGGYVEGAAHEEGTPTSEETSDARV